MSKNISASDKIVPPFVVVSQQNNIDLQPNNSDQINNGPRIDYVEIARELKGELIGRNITQKNWYRWIKPIEKKIRLDISLASYVAANSSRNQVILSASEKIAIPLAIWQLLKHDQTKHVVIGHKLSSGAKTVILKKMGLGKHFHSVITLCRSQSDYAINELGVPSERVHFIYDKVDELFWKPDLREPEGNYILAVGQEQRDYATLVEAVQGTGIQVKIVASSPWSSNRKGPINQEKVTVLKNLPYPELRKLYAGARLVVLPLLPSDYAAGANGVLEAMAMGKPVIVTKTIGIQDYVIDQETGIFVPPQNAANLREAIQNLWNNPALLSRLGKAARDQVEAKMTMNRYVEQVCNIVLAT